MAPTKAAPEQISYYHLSGALLEPGSVIMPGNWGRIVTAYGWPHFTRKEPKPQGNDRPIVNGGSIRRDVPALDDEIPFGPEWR
jgi:hypothetical protein